MGALLTGGRAGDKSTSEGAVDARPTTVAEASATTVPDGGINSMGHGAGGKNESERGGEGEEDIQVFHCVCSNIRSVRHVRRTLDGRFVVIPSGKSSASAAWPEEEDISECPRCGVWGHKACLEYVVPPQFALSGAGAAYTSTTPACSDGGGVNASRHLREDGETSATRITPELSATPRMGETDVTNTGCGAGTAKVLESGPPPVEARVFRPVCWMCMQEKEEAAAMVTGACGGGAAAPVPRRAGKGSGGSHSGAGGGGGSVCSTTRGWEGEGSGSANKKESKQKTGEAGETAEGETAEACEANDGGGGSGVGATSGKAGARASAPSVVARTVESAKRARVGPRLLGKEVLVSDGVAAVLTGVVTAIEAGQARIHYKGRNAKLDEWIDVRSERFLSASEVSTFVRLSALLCSCDDPHTVCEYVFFSSISTTHADRFHPTSCLSGPTSFCPLVFRPGKEAD